MGHRWEVFYKHTKSQVTVTKRLNVVALFKDLPQQIVTLFQKSQVRLV